MGTGFKWTDYIVAKTGQKVASAHCGRRLRIQTPKNCPTYYREESHLRGYHDCPYIGQSMRADLIDDQVAELIRSIHLLDNWEPIVRQMLDNQRERADPEAERTEIRGMLRLMRDNFERGLYEAKSTSTGRRSAV